MHLLTELEKRGHPHRILTKYTLQRDKPDFSHNTWPKTQSAGQVTRVCVFARVKLMLSFSFASLS